MTYKLPLDTVDSDVRDVLATGEATMSRRVVSSQGVAGTSGSMRLAYFQARKTETVTKVQTATGTTAQSASTLCRVGIYSVAANGDITLVASTADAHATLWVATTTLYETALSASFNKVRGTWYAVGLLSVGAAPTWIGQIALPGDVANAAPKLGGVMTGLSDLPTGTTAAASIAGTGHIPYAVLVP